MRILECTATGGHAPLVEALAVLAWRRTVGAVCYLTPPMIRHFYDICKLKQWLIYVVYAIIEMS